MLRRAILPVLQRRLDTYPAVALVGPRQTGKTTLGRSLSSVYFDLEQPDVTIPVHPSEQGHTAIIA
jgi:hypothetical protein